MAEYKGSIELISGITQKGGGDFPLASAKDIQVDDDGTRLNTKLGEIDDKLKTSSSTLPAVTENDNGKTLSVIDGEWSAAKPASALPAVTENDNGKVLSVVGGAWAAAEAASGVIPFFDLAAMGLPEVPGDGTTANLTVDTTEIKSSLDNGSVKFALNAEFAGRMEFVMNKYSTDAYGLYACIYNMPDSAIILMIADGSIQASIVPISALPDVSETDNGKVLGVSGGAWAAITPVSGGVASWNTLTDRPFGDNEDGTVTQLDNKYLSILSQTGGWGALLPQNTGESYYNANWGAYTFGFQTTQEMYEKWVANTSAIRVKFDGKMYTATPQVLNNLTMVGNSVGFGGTGNDEPFVLGIVRELTDGQFSYHWLVGALTDTSPTEHTVSVSMFDAAIYTVNEDNLPMDAIKAVVDDYIDEALGGDY